MSKVQETYERSQEIGIRARREPKKNPNRKLEAREKGRITNQRPWLIQVTKEGNRQKDQAIQIGVQ